MRRFIILTLLLLPLLLSIPYLRSEVRAASKQDGGILMSPLWTTGIITDDVGRAGIVVTDLNNDNIRDILSCSQKAFYVLNATPQGEDYLPRYYSQRLSCQKVAVGDRNSDGIQEIYVAAIDDATSTQRTLVYVYNGATFEQESVFVLSSEYTPIQGLTVANVDNDSAPEIVLVREDRTFVFASTNGALEWDAFGYGGYGVAVGNIDNDSLNEIVVRNTPGHVLSAVTQTEEFAYPDGFGWDMDVGDVDGDNRAEIVYGGPHIYVVAAESQTIQYTVTLPMGLTELCCGRFPILIMAFQPLLWETRTTMGRTKSCGARG